MKVSEDCIYTCLSMLGCFCTRTYTVWKTRKADVSCSDGSHLSASQLYGCNWNH